ncbi:MAG: uroporphyrinogen decarboxylase family protein, partial [Deltaproteobacteria bacterium]
FLETGPLVDPLPLTIAYKEDVDEIPCPDVRKVARLPVFLEAVQRLSEYGKGDLPVIGLFEGPFTTTCRIIEAELILRMIIKNRPVLEVLLDRINETLLEFGHALVDSGANIIIIPEPTSSSSMISPSIFRQMVMPRLQRLTSKLDVPCILHICGDTYSMLEAMEETGAEVLSLDQCMDLSESRARIPKAVLGGNVDPIESLLMGTKEQVVMDTLNCLRRAGTSRFILMSGCGIPPKAPVENVKAMVRTATEYGLGNSGDVHKIIS